MPDLAELPDKGFPWQEQWAVNLKCLDGTDAGIEVIYKPTTVGGIQAVAGLIEAVRDRLNGGQHDGKVVADRAAREETATRTLSTGRYGRQRSRSSTGCRWSGPAPAPAPAPPAAAAAAPSSRVAGASDSAPMFGSDRTQFMVRLRSSRPGGSISRPSEPIRYAATANAIVCAYAVGDAPAQTWHADGAILDWDHAPPDLRAAFDRGATFAAWNASFDAAIWNYATLGFPFLPPERVIDPMVQAGVANLPTDLESASRALGGAGKQKDGKKLIRLFCVEGAAPSEHPEEWQRFLAYARQDVEAMRDVYRRTRPLPLEEWQQYWAFEHINRRGVGARRAVRAPRRRPGGRGRRRHRPPAGRTDRRGRHPRHAGQTDRGLAARSARRRGDARGADGRRSGDDDDDDDDDDEAEPHEFSLTRDRVARVLAMLDAKRANGGLDPAETKALEVATLRLYGAGASPKKFARLDAQQVDGVLRGQYRFAGAGQTGRMSRSGAQIQNLTRDVLGEDGAAEAALVDAIADGCSYAELAAADPVDVPVARKLALLVRPALIAGPGKVFVWSDWSAIEARITPWLAASAGAEKVLDIFRANDRDPTQPDIYTLAAADILHKDPRGDHEDGTRDRQGGHARARFRRLGRRAAEHGAELPHPSR